MIKYEDRMTMSSKAYYMVIRVSFVMGSTVNQCDKQGQEGVICGKLNVVLE